MPTLVVGGKRVVRGKICNFLQGGEADQRTVPDSGPPCAGQRSDQVIPGQIYDQVHLVRSDQVHLVMTRYTWS